MRTSSVEEWWNVCVRPFLLLVKGVKGGPFRENLFEEERFLIPKVNPRGKRKNRIQSNCITSGVSCFICAGGVVVWCLALKSLVSTLQVLTPRFRTDQCQ